MTNVLNVKFLPFDLLGSSKNQPLLRTCNDLPGKYLHLISIGNENKPSGSIDRFLRSERRKPNETLWEGKCYM